MTLRINSEAPNFTTETTQGTINFHDWIGDGWAVLFSHPKDFTPICTTELGYMAGLQSEFAKRNCKVIGISIDGVADHDKWSKDIQSFSGNSVGYPLYMKPYDGGGWRGVSRIENEESLRTAYDGSGKLVMHLQRSVEDAI